MVASGSLEHVKERRIFVFTDGYAKSCSAAVFKSTAQPRSSSVVVLLPADRPVVDGQQLFCLAW